jgi:uncharacterized peroxidase-related enzyme
MSAFAVPTREQVSETNAAIFDQLKKGLGMVPNLYATFAHSDTALETYLALQNAKSSLKAKEREIVNLVVSQVNGCEYCLAAHTALGKMVGFTDEQIIAIRKAEIDFDPRFDALAKFVRETTEKRGHVSAMTKDALMAQGWTAGQVVDVLIVVGDKIISNYLHAVTQIPVDFPKAPALA